ncbi:MAG: hypothetical protein WCV86_02025 [Patescibacteria group bacterium]
MKRFQLLTLAALVCVALFAGCGTDSVLAPTNDDTASQAATQPITLAPQPMDHNITGLNTTMSTDAPVDSLFLGPNPPPPPPPPPAEPTTWGGIKAKDWKKVTR